MGKEASCSGHWRVPVSTHVRTPTPIWGAKAIGEVIGITEAKAFHWLENGRLPAKKVGGRWMSEVGELHRWMTSFNNPDAAA